MDRSQADAHIAQLGREMGLPELSLDEGGVCMVALDGDDLAVTLGHDAAGALRVLVCLDDVTPTGGQLAQLMAANFAGARTEGGTFALAPVTGALVLQRRCGVEDLQAGGLAAVVAGLARAARTWRVHLQTPVAAPQASTPFLGDRA